MFLTISNFPNKKEFYRNKNGSGNRVVLYWYCKKEVREMGRIVQIDKRRLVWMKESDSNNNQSVECWATNIKSLIKASRNNLNTKISLHPSKPVLFLVNPKSGSGFTHSHEFY